MILATLHLVYEIYDSMIENVIKAISQKREIYDSMIENVIKAIFQREKLNIDNFDVVNSILISS